LGRHSIPVHLVSCDWRVPVRLLSRSEASAAAATDRIYPEFIWNHLPRGIAGLVIAAILAAAMSNLSAALNSLASTTIMDFYKPITANRYPEAHYLKLAATPPSPGAPCSSSRSGREELGQRPAGRTVNRLHPLRLAAGRLFAGLADKAGWRKRRNGGHDRQPGSDSLR